MEKWLPFSCKRHQIGHLDFLSARLLTEGLGSGTNCAELLLNFRLQMGCLGATEECVTQTKETKIGLCEQVR